MLLTIEANEALTSRLMDKFHRLNCTMHSITKTIDQLEELK